MGLDTQQGNEIKDWPKVAIIILNWNGWKDTIECLESLQRLTYPNYQIIVVDNGSTDGSIEKIKAWAQGGLKVESKFFQYDPSKKPVKWIEYDMKTIANCSAVTNISDNRTLIFIRTGENLGFAGGNNIGIKYALHMGASYVWLLNNDTVVLPETLTSLVKLFSMNPNLGIVSPKICYYSNSNKIWFAGGRLGLLRACGYNLSINKLDSSRYTGFILCSFITGCAMLIKRDVFYEIGLLDSSYFLYVEDVDFSLRASKNGWELGTDLDNIIYHKVSSSSNDALAIQTYYVWRNRMYFSAKHHSKIQRFVFNTFWILSRTLKIILWLAKGRVDVILSAIKGCQSYKEGMMGYHDI